jgi:hypothetical protein
MDRPDHKPKRILRRFSLALLKLGPGLGDFILFIILVGLCAGAVQLVNIVFSLWEKKG